MRAIEIRSVDVVQYIKPLREGGSLPAIVKGDDGFLYVLKFRGAGQGKKALIADFIGGELARAIGLKVPEMVFMNLDNSFSRTEPDEEIQDLLKFSVGLNLGVHFLSGAITYDPLVSKVEGLMASKLVLLDSLISNIDRTAKNPNLLLWHNELWIIDNGASFYFHHHWDTWKNHLTKTFPLVKDHVLLSQATEWEAASAEILKLLDENTLQKILSEIPEDWLKNETDLLSNAEMRIAYFEYLQSKLCMMDQLVEEAKNAR